MEWRSPPGEGVLQRCAASSSSCRRLQEATCRVENLAGLLSHFWDDQTNRDHKARPGREQNRTETLRPPGLPPNPPSGPPGVNPRGLARLCQPSLLPGHFLPFCSSSLLSCDLPRQGGREVSPPGAELILLWYYQLTAQV